jgi:hypothetical protein
MSYIAINEYSRKWIFTHQSMPMSDDQLATLKPMTQTRSAMFWQENVSKMSPDAERLAKEDWPMKESNWLSTTSWMDAWDDDDDLELPSEVLEHIDWQDDVTVYFCYEKYNVIETKWKTFRENWKNFLFYDDGPILLGRRRDQALWFNTDGTVKIGVRR